ncbi:DNA polymerase delta subunit 4-like [Montipora foliosa]|uniref:DNA polymerase delta subunit 4-like n=1 Tax=Montipora foliosa TaxID=591990 RepID=UPI0035F1FE08
MTIQLFFALRRPVKMASSKLITESFPKTKKDRPIIQKLPKKKTQDLNDRDAELFKESSLKDQKQDLEKEFQLLKEFDLDSEYGPCIGITRLERWERAEEYGLYPPKEVKEIILQHPGDTTYTECVWYNTII